MRYKRLFLMMKLSYLEKDDRTFRKDLAAYYIENLNNKYVALPDTLPMEENAFHLFPILVSENRRDALHDYLRTKWSRYCYSLSYCSS